MMCGELQMRVGDKAGLVLVTPVLNKHKVQLQEAVLPLPGMMAESWEGKEEVDTCSSFVLAAALRRLGCLYSGEQHL